jgi:pyruvate,water dikinase
VLERYDFRVEQRSDTLLARLKKKPTEYLEQRLQVLGYLTLHTRQIDMVMNSAGAVEQYKRKFIDDIELMLAGKAASNHGESGHAGEGETAAGR